MAEMEGDDEVPKIKLGDASCAAPFTSKLSHVAASKYLFTELAKAFLTILQSRTLLGKDVALLWRRSKCTKFLL